MSMCLLSYLEPKILMSLKITMLPSNRRLRQASQGFASLLPSKCREEAEGLRSMMHVNSLFQETHQGVSRNKMYLETRFNIIEVFQIIFAIPSTLHSSELQQLQKNKGDDGLANIKAVLPNAVFFLELSFGFRLSTSEIRHFILGDVWSFSVHAQSHAALPPSEHMLKSKKACAK